MTNQIDQTIITLKNQPVFSGLCAIFGTAATAGFLTQSLPDPPLNIPFLAAFLLSPLVSAGLGVSATVNLFRDRSGLSKVFSTAAAGSAAIGIGAQALMLGSSALAGPLYTMMGMSAAGALNVAAHYLRKTHIGITADSGKKSANNADDKTPVSKPDDSNNHPM